LKLNLLKKLLSVVLSSFFFLIFNSVPANAVADGPVNCGTRGTFTVASNVVTGNTGCVGDVIIPSGVTSIGPNAFKDNYDIYSVVIPDSVLVIDAGAFWGADEITSLTIGNGVTTIGEDAFNRVIKITTLNIPNSVTTIGNRAFTFNNALTSVTIGNSVTSIGDSAFENNSSLNSVTFLGLAAPTVGGAAFTDGCDCATANVPYNATGFGANGSTWNYLRVIYGSAPAEESGSTSAPTLVPTAAKTPDAIFNLKNKKYVSKNSMKTKLRKNKSFKRNPQDLFKYSIFGTSKKTCIMRGNYVMGLKKNGACEMWVTRTTAKGAKYKYWVKINYSK
jgi:hypothetical protein